MARAVANKKAPALRKNVNSPKPLLRVAGPCTPVVSHVRPAGNSEIPAVGNCVLKIMATTPQSTNKQMISDFVQAVATAPTVNKTPNKKTGFQGFWVSL